MEDDRILQQKNFINKNLLVRLIQIPSLHIKIKKWKN